MIHANPRLRRFSIATAILVLAAGPARAEPQPPPPPPPAGPVPMPYPNPEPLPPSPCPRTICLPNPGATQGGGEIAAHKHLGSVKYSDFAKGGEVSTAAAPDNNVSSAAGDAQVIEVQSISWDAGTVYSADPMEGGQVASARTRPGRPTYGNITVTEPTDTASPKLDAATSEPGKLEIPNGQVAGNAEPVARGTASFKTLAGVCATGKHLDKVKIVTRSQSFTLHDAIVTSVTPASDGMETVSLTYAGRDD